MPIRRARDHDDLHEAIVDHDVVVVPDAPLARVIAGQVTEPRLGHVASTPADLAAPRDTGRNDRHEGFLAVRRATDLDWATASRLVDRVLECWRHTGRVDAIVEYDRYDDGETRAVVDALAGLETTEAGALADYQIPRGRSVAVVGETLLAPLERSILPERYERVDPFVDADFELPTVHVFDSAAAIVDATLEAIEPGNAGDVAVVCPADGEYATLVEAGLAAEGVPYHGGPSFVDDPDRRAVLGLLRAIHAGSGTRVGTVRPVLERLGVDVPVAHDEKRLDAVDPQGPAVLRSLQAAADPGSDEPPPDFADVLAAYERTAGANLAAFRARLSGLSLLAAPVTPAAVDRLAFYLRTYDPPEDREDEGVLVADATAATHVDRPLVFHLGLDEGWLAERPRRPWIDRERTFRRDIARFELMLQSGRERYYFVRDGAGGDPVAPCPYFRELYDGVERFSDFETVREVRRFSDSGAGFATGAVPATYEPVDAVSQSTLNRLVNSPRDHVLSRLVDGPDRDYFEEGRLFHDFAEVYANDPDAVASDEIETVVEFMLAETAAFYPTEERPLRRVKYRAGLRTIAAFLEERAPEPVSFLTEDTGWGSNAVADELGLSVDAPTTERWFENRDVGVQGVVDLVHGPDGLVDYKSGRRKRATEVVGNAAIDPPADTPDYQALAYLAHWRTVNPDEELEFTFVHFLEALDGAVTGDLDIDDVLTTITYYPVAFHEYVPSRDAYDVLRDGYGDCRETFEALGYDAFAEIAGRHVSADAVGDEALPESPFAEGFTDDVERAVGDAADDPAKGASQAVRALDRVRRRNFFRDDVDAFEAFLDDRIAELNRYRTGAERAPVAGPGGEANFDRADHRDMLLGDEDG